MLTSEEEKFFVFWEENRLKEKSIFKQLSFGLGFGLLMAVGILASLVSGWYTRANMVANSQSTPLILLFGLFLIVVFCSYFYKQHKWEMNEQHFLELKYKKERDNSLQQVQHNEQNNSQVN